MGACVGGTQLPILGFGTGIFYTDADTVRAAIVHAAKHLGYKHFECVDPLERTLGYLPRTLPTAHCPLPTV